MAQTRHTLTPKLWSKDKAARLQAKIDRLEGEKAEVKTLLEKAMILLGEWQQAHKAAKAKK